MPGQADRSIGDPRHPHKGWLAASVDTEGAAKGEDSNLLKELGVCGEFDPVGQQSLLKPSCLPRLDFDHS